MIDCFLTSLTCSQLYNECIYWYTVSPYPYNIMRQIRLFVGIHVFEIMRILPAMEMYICTLPNVLLFLVNQVLTDQLCCLLLHEVLTRCMNSHEPDWYRVVNVAHTRYTRGYSLIAFKQLYLIREREKKLLMYLLDKRASFLCVC